MKHTVKIQMKLFHAIALASFFYARCARADTLITPGLLSAPSSTPTCLAVNVRSGAFDVTVELRDDNNASLGSVACPKLPGGHICAVSAPRHSGGVYCMVTTPRPAAHEALPERLVTTMMMVDENGEVTSAVAGRIEDTR